MTEKTDDDGNPRIALGGKLWTIPPLAAKQNRIIDPLIITLLPIFSIWHKEQGALAQLDAVKYDALLEIAFQAIRKASPDTTRDQFLDLPVTLPELIEAFTVIAQQTGVFTRGAPGEAAGAGSPQNPLIGMPSSPMSAT